MPAAPTKMPISAVPMGRPIAITEPNAMSSTTTATAMPIISLPGSFSPMLASVLSNSVCTPAALVVAAAFVASSKLRSSSLRTVYRTST